MKEMDFAGVMRKIMFHIKAQKWMDKSWDENICLKEIVVYVMSALVMSALVMSALVRCVC